MHPFIEEVHARAKAHGVRIVFPEGGEERILRATEVILQNKLAEPILIGNPQEIAKRITTLGLKLDKEALTIIDPAEFPQKDAYAHALYEARKHKGVTEKQAEEMLSDINYLGTMMVHLGEAEGMVTGTTFPTDDSIRPALEIIKTQEKFHKVSGVFFMILEERVLLFADTAITINPNSHDLVDIAEDTAETARKFGLTPRIAFLSFSTKGSADDPEVDKVQEAVAMMKDAHPGLVVDGELQVDAALVPKVARSKCPDSPIQGDANILIFPNLAAANIAYKLVERLAHAEAVGPLLQGLKKPVNDLSRGCDYEDIVNVTAFTACEAAQSAL